MWSILEALFEIILTVRQTLRARGGHASVRLDLVVVDVATNADIDRHSGPLITV